ncbi:MAG: hypothetical protein H5U40_18130, partial [Polyangiaceae bacterium]|nr:hypothetical protein [Polyangiaceae bacterium]
ECAPGLTCDTFPGTCGATCKAVDTLEHQVELGGVCYDFDSCVYGALCDGTCKLLAIVADHPVGEPCSLMEEDATTRTYHTCEAGLGCAVGQGGPTCVERLAAGADCTANTAVPCVAGHACLPDPEPATTHSCRPMHVATEVGADCTDFLAYTGGDLTFCDATLDLYCGSTATCVAAGNGSAGSTCIVEGEGAQYRAPCDPGLYCDDVVTNECTAKKAADEPCEADEECLSDLCLGDLCAESYCDTTDYVI